MRTTWVTVCLGAVYACSHSQRDSASGARERSPESASVVFTVTRLDGRQLPTGYSTPRGRYSLRGATLTLDPDGNLSFDTDLIPDPDTVGGRVSRTTLVGTYRRAGEDSLVFPADRSATPEFFGRLDGHGGLRLVAHPLPRASGAPSASSVSAAQGGAHVWEFHVR